MKNDKKKPDHGALYVRNGRYYWKVKLPGDTERRTYPLAQAGEKPTRNRGVAVVLANRMWNKAAASLSGTPDFETIGELVSAYRQHINDKYPPSSDMPSRIGYALDLMEMVEHDPVDSFGPLKLRQVRNQMVGKGLSVSYVNERTQFIRNLFKWAAGREIVRPEAVYALEQVENLTGRDPGVEESQERQPVSIDVVRQTLPELTKTLQDMVRIQLYGAMRPSEMLRMRPCDLDTQGEYWIYRIPQSRSKNQARKKDYVRAVPLNTKVQDLLLTYLMGARQDQTFFPYTSASYRRAVTRACEKVFGKDSDKRWTPYQLRHTAATYIRQQLGDDGLTAAQKMLGQRHVETTEIYARADEKIAITASEELSKIDL